MPVIIEIPFSTDEASELPSSGLIPFDPNIDMSSSCFVCSDALLELSGSVNQTIIAAAIGAVQPIDVNTEAFVMRWMLGTVPTADLIFPFYKLNDVYLAKGFSGWSVESAIGNITGRILLFGEIVACNETIMALVTFDYSSLINVSTGAVVRSRKAVAKEGEF